MFYILSVEEKFLAKYNSHFIFFLDNLERKVSIISELTLLYLSKTPFYFPESGEEL